MVYTTCKRILCNDTDAEDVTQECFEILARCERVPDTPRVGPWLHTVATNRSLQYLRSKRRRRGREARFAAGQSKQTATEWRDIYEYIDEAVAGLPQELRVPVVAHFIEGRSHAAIGRELGLSRRAVSYRISKGVERIAGTLKERGIRIASSVLAAVLGANLAEAAPISSGLASSLGKLTLACSVEQAVRGAATAAGAAPLLGGALIIKKIVIGSLVLIVCAGVTVKVLQQAQEAEQPSEIVAEEASKAGVDRGQSSANEYLIAARDDSSQNSLITAMATEGEGYVPDAEVANTSKTVTDQDLTRRAISRTELAKQSALDELSSIYGLEENESLRHLKPPFHPARQGWPESPDAMVFMWSEHAFRNWGEAYGTSFNLFAVLGCAAKIPKYKVEGDMELLTMPLEGDFVYRENSTTEEVLSDLEQILLADFHLPVSLQFMEVERMHYIVRGAYEYMPASDELAANDSRIAIFADQLPVKELGRSGGSGDFREFLIALGKLVDRPIIDEVELPPQGNLSWEYNSTALQEDWEPAQVLGNIADQTGLAFYEVLLPVEILFIERKLP